MEDFSGNAYYHMVNQVAMSGKTGFGLNGCCTGNVHQGWPKFIMSGVQTTDGGATVVVSGLAPYNATLADGTTVQIGGQYPFADDVTVTVRFASSSSSSSTSPVPPSSPPTAPTPRKLALRIPCWADGARVAVASAPPSEATPCAYFHVTAPTP